PFDRSFNAGAYAVGDLHKICRVFGLNEMFVATVAVTQVIAKMDVRRYRIAELTELIKNSGLPLSRGWRKQALPKGELERYVPLNGQLGVGNFLGDLLELAHHRVRVGGQHTEQLIRFYKKGHGCHRRWEGDQHSRVLADLAGTL